MAMIVYSKSNCRPDETLKLSSKAVSAQKTRVVNLAVLINNALVIANTNTIHRLIVTPIRCRHGRLEVTELFLAVASDSEPPPNLRLGGVKRGFYLVQTVLGAFY
eukprot:6175357-Pleurochrysis_carterae.AAC.2